MDRKLVYEFVWSYSPGYFERESGNQDVREEIEFVAINTTQQIIEYHWSTMNLPIKELSQLWIYR